ncbi:MAG TPA: type II toxin-antitoxin system RelE/ParE family toxin [Gemmataceae bacterium]|nr:type II toxin-antitoxin system RelE/ParE family toxin [Gemmataceae bacterium]
MSRTVRIAERARADVDAIFNWLAPRSVAGAISWYMAFRRAVEKIGELSESYGEAAEAHRLRRPLRQAMFKTRRGRTYRVVFEVFETEVILLRVRGPGQAPLRRRDLPDQ